MRWDKAVRVLNIREHQATTLMHDDPQDARYEIGQGGQGVEHTRAPGYDAYARRSPGREACTRPCETTGVPSAQRQYEQNVHHGTSAPVKQLGAYHGGHQSNRLADTLRRSGGWGCGERGFHTGL